MYQINPLYALHLQNSYSKCIQYYSSVLPNVVNKNDGMGIWKSESNINEMYTLLDSAPRLLECTLQIHSPKGAKKWV